MRILALAAAALVVLLILTLAARYTDKFRDGIAWQTLAKTARGITATFDPAMLAGLPEPARRYFTFSIAPGTRLSPVATFEMEGEMGLGDKSAPNYQPMTAKQILAPPLGLVWRMKAGAISGSDGAMPDTSWTRFWLFNLVPVVRASGDPDHHRSAFGRVVAEAAFWTPAALLPSETVTWQGLTANTARATITANGFTQFVEITVDHRGAPTQVLIDRWSNANPSKTWQLQPFGGTLSDYDTFDGFTVPTRVEGGNFFGTDAYFPFFKANVTAMRFL